MPRYPIERSTNFIIEEESWNLIEYDHTSVPGTIYLSLTEGKINSIYDDVEKGIADTDKLAKYDLLVPVEQQEFKIGSVIHPVFTLTKNGVPSNLKYTLLSTNNAIVKRVNEELTAVGAGIVNLIVQLNDYPTIQKTFTISVVEDEPDVVSAYIDGVSTIRLDRIAEYTLQTTLAAEVIKFNLYHTEVLTKIYDSNGEEQLDVYSEYRLFQHPKQAKSYIGIKQNNTSYVLEETMDKRKILAEITKQENNSCTIRANKNNNLGYVVLGCVYGNGQEVFKPIEIIPLW